MPPTPKPASQRQRRNKSVTASTLRAVPDAVVPDLPPRMKTVGEKDDLEPLEVEVPWHAMTLAWWQDIWTSPMAPEFLDSDVHGLYVLAALVDQFWREPSTALAAEMRLQRQCFGLTPVDRRRLEWHVEQAEQAVEKTTARRQRKTPKSGKDPRDALSAVS